ncbi:MAG TPA: thiamine phosphate synthase [Rhizomicrobium sp.]|nr:thiamine phosphate synthase [Rhizomicrobium sp.]
MSARFFAAGEAVESGEDIAVADSLARAQLARAAESLRRAAVSPLPGLVLLTDDTRLPDPRAAIMALPRGSLVVVRAREEERRTVLANLLVHLARAQGLKWLVADDPSLAARMGSDGAHFPERKIVLAASWRVRRPDWLITCAAHSVRACLQARRAGANAVLLAPIFATGSHRGQPVLGKLRASAIARRVPLPFYALGGVDAQTARQLKEAPFVGLAAIGGLDVQNQDANRCARDTVNV